MPAFPAVVMARLKDNIYIVLCSIDDKMQAGLRIALESLLHVIYGIAFKWEEHGAHVSWCESMLTWYEGRWVLLRKGVCLSLPESPLQDGGSYEWAKWTPGSSPNAPDVIRTFLPFASTQVYVECERHAMRAHKSEIHVLGCGGQPLPCRLVETPTETLFDAIFPSGHCV